MDLGKFIQRQRQHTIAILSLLSGRQVNLVQKMSRLMIYDGSHPAQLFDDNEHSDDLENQVTRGNFAKLCTKKFTSSQDKVDQRLLSLFRVK